MTPLVTPYFSLTLVCHHAPKKGVGALGIEALFGHMSIAGVPISQDLVNIAFVGVFLGIPLVALLVARIYAARRNRVEERIPKATFFSGDLLDELPESMKPEVLGVPFCGQVGGRVFALSTLPGLSAIAVVLGGFVALIFMQGSLGASVNTDKLQDVLARADAHRRWIIQRYRSGEARLARRARWRGALLDLSERAHSSTGLPLCC